MIITAIKAAAFVAFLGIAIGLIRPSANHHVKQQISAEHVSSKNFQEA